MIKGLTHDEDGSLHKITKYKGKISTGFAPGEGPNKEAYPVPAGFFRMLKEQVVTERIGPTKKLITRKEWVINPPIQEAIEKAISSTNGTPRRIEIVCLHKSPEDMWESSMSMYSSSEGLMCKSNGEGTTAKKLIFTPNGDRSWINRSFNGVEGCSFKNCQDYKDKKCKPIGLLKCFPVADLSVNPYRFETRSINTIIGMESSIYNFYELLKAAHFIKQIEAGKDLPFDGFFGSKFYLVHKKIKSGGKDVFVTDIMPTQEFTDSVIEPIKRGIAKKVESSKMIGESGNMSILELAGQSLISNVVDKDKEIETESVIIDGPVYMDIEDGKDIAVNFMADADVEVVAPFESSIVNNNASGDKGAEAARALLNDDNNTPNK